MSQQDIPKQAPWIGSNSHDSDDEDLFDAIELPKHPSRPKRLNFYSNLVYEYNQSDETNRVKKVVMNEHTPDSFLLLFSKSNVIELVHQRGSLFRTEPNPDRSPGSDEFFLDAVYLPGIRSFILITQYEVLKKDISSNPPSFLVKFERKMIKSSASIFAEMNTNAFINLFKISASSEHVLIRYESLANFCLVFNAKTRKVEISHINAITFTSDTSKFRLFGGFKAVFGFFDGSSYFNLFDIKKRSLLIRKQKIFDTYGFRSHSASFSPNGDFACFNLTRLFETKSSELSLYRICPMELQHINVIKTPGILSNPFGLGRRFELSLFLWAKPKDDEVRLVGYDSVHGKLSTLGLEILLNFRDKEGEMDAMGDLDDLGQVWGCVYYPGSERKIWRVSVTY